MVFALVADGIRVRFDKDLHQFRSVFAEKIHIHQNSKNIANLVWKFLQQFLGIFYSDRNAFVIFPEDKGSSARVRKSRNPLQIFVPPGFFPFDGLMFGHFEKSECSRAVFMSPGARPSASTVAAWRVVQTARAQREWMSVFMLILIGF
jgi:hypothetical protein